MSFLGEIKRRKVFQVAAVYAVVAWLVVQIVDVVGEPLNLPGWIDAVVIVLLAAGFPIAVILAWAFDLTPQGIKADSAIQGSSSPAQVGGQRLNYLLQGLVLVAVGFLVLDQYLLEPRASSIAVSAVSTTARVTRFDYELPEGQSFRNTLRRVMALSPDGRHFVYNTSGGLYLRTMDELEARLLPGTASNITSPSFSPDGQSVVYEDRDSNELKRISISGGAPVVITGIDRNVRGLSWQADDSVLYGHAEGIYRVAANGDTPELIIPVEEGTVVYGPEFLPDGDSVLFSVGVPGEWDTAQIVSESLSTGEQRMLIEGGSDARYLPTGHLVYAFEDGLFAVGFDLDSLTVSGGAVSLVQGVMRATGTISGAANYGVSEDGTLVYVAGGAAQLRSLVWVDRAGREEAIPAEPSAEYRYPRISPDGTRAVVDDWNRDRDLWVWDFMSETRSRLTIGQSGGSYPVWTSDNERIVYGSGTGDIDWKAANNTGTPERLATGVATLGSDPPSPYFFSPSGTELVFRDQGNPETNDDIGMIVIGGDAEPVWLLREPHIERNAELSPDGRWMAYQSDESGRFEIYVRPFPNVDDDRVQVSNASGLKPLWSRDGRELFYLELGPPERLISVSVETTETDFSFGARTPILDWSYLGVFDEGRTYDVSLDGQQFLAIKVGGTEGRTPQIIVVQNWFEELKRLAPSAE